MLINPFNPLVECAFAFGGGVKPFVHAVFRPFSLNEWKLEIVLFQGIDTYQAVLNALTQEHAKQYIYPCHSQTARFGNPAFCINNKDLISWISDLRSKMTIPCQAVLDSVSQEQTEQYIYSRHPELDSGSIQNDFLSISINRFRVKHGMTIKGALDAVSQEQTILPLSKGEDRMLNERKRINSILGEGSSCRIDTYQAVLNALTQEHAKQYISPRHPELDSGSIQNDFLSININRFRVKHGMTIKGAPDTASQEQTKLESSLPQGKDFNPYPSPLTGEGERSSDEGDIKTSSKRCACYGLSNLFKHNGRLKSTLHDYEQFSILKPLTRPSGTLCLDLFALNGHVSLQPSAHRSFPQGARATSQQFQASHLNTSEKGRYKNLQFQAWHLNTSTKGRYKSQQFQAWHNNSNMKGGDNKCLA